MVKMYYDVNVKLIHLFIVSVGVLSHQSSFLQYARMSAVGSRLSAVGGVDAT